MNDNPSTILIVDDLHSNRVLAQRVVESAGYQVITADSGKLALQLVSTQKIDLILLDIMMPGFNGFDTCRVLKQNTLHVDMPIIFLTALEDAQSLSKAFELGGVDYITKPFQRIELLAKIKNHLELMTLHKIQAEFIHAMSSENLSLHSQKNHLEDLLSALQPANLRQQLHELETICAQVSGQIQTTEPQASYALTQAQQITITLKSSLEALELLTGKPT
jgi:DNA-binding response OmpR family regulator